ncbi:MAG TPA: FxsA family protein, partial [Rhodospirillales bacterium]|nr:FxsA family protein [Rhodospirillales bacterium]
GSILVRAQGFAIVQQARSTLHAGRFPAREVFDGACVLIGGALLMFPGFLSDALGVLLLTPPVRGLLRQLIAGVIRRSGRFDVFVAEAPGPQPPGGGGPVIDGEYRPVDDASPRLIPGPASPSPAGSSHPDAPASPWQRP